MFNFFLKKNQQKFVCFVYFFVNLLKQTNLNYFNYDKFNVSFN
jgi:hypothetical protein